VPRKPARPRREAERVTATRYWIAATADGGEALLRRLPGRDREIWVAYRPRAGERPFPPALDPAAQPKEVGRAAAERFLRQHWVAPAFLDAGDPAPPPPGRFPDWSWERIPVVPRPLVRDEWVAAPPID
jgi:hypothetical protein